MSELIHIDKEYKTWIENLVLLYRQQQVRAAVKVNEEVIRFYWTLGKDISEKAYDNKYGSHFYEILSLDLRSEMSNAKGLSESNIRYAKRFYSLYVNLLENLQQPAEKSALMNFQQSAEIFDALFSVPWTHHLYIIDKTKGDSAKAFFYVRKTLENNYCVPLHRYVVVEVKTGKFDSCNVGQLGTYVVAVNHQLNTEGDNPAIGLLICQEKDNVLAQYALESSNQPLDISEYELAQALPKDIKSSLPSIEDIENELNNN